MISIWLAVEYEFPFTEGTIEMYRFGIFYARL